MNGQEVDFEAVLRGEHERCQNPRCRYPFFQYEGRLLRVKGQDGKYYCDAKCASHQYLTASIQ